MQKGRPSTMQEERPSAMLLWRGSAINRTAGRVLYIHWSQAFRHICRAEGFYYPERKDSTMQMTEESTMNMVGGGYYHTGRKVSIMQSHADGRGSCRTDVR
jgi:hypothetical protein